METTVAPNGVTIDALIKRINRRLARDGLRLEMEEPTRRDRAWAGDFFVVEDDGYDLMEVHVDPEQYARKIGVLGDNEKMVRE